MFELMLATGIRIGSALALDVEDVDAAGGELNLRTMRGGGGQTVYFNERIGSLLVSLIGSRAQGPLFTSRQRRRLSARQAARRLERWCSEAGLQRPTCYHQLRHSFATDLHRRTGDVLVVQAALGHRSIASTLVYARTGAAAVRAAVCSA